ncbi:hypothetical protein [Paraburkholderia sp. DHOC27]|uniref:hypothetical protein n=1 Tax=Paraburkholderia sp. DHOC27 TaxID=2303330 RepID=UPI000E3BFDFC|nr:hypothetical protein [Paraburkholderia sp. DHOC27]RFU45652.1 hypothetical protein D0B32_23990 [Paraburkholderia sp. DHOC27]
MENVARLEAHYYLKDGSHSIDAFIRNRCEAEFLATVSYIAHCLGTELRFEASIAAEGGFRDIWRVLVRKDNRTLSVTTFTTILATLLELTVQIWLAAPKPNPELERQQLEINRLNIEHSKIENLRSELEVKKLQHELNASTPITIRPSLPELTGKESATSSSNAPRLAQLANYLSPSTFIADRSNLISLQQDPKLNRRRSNFYKQLISCGAVTAVGFRWIPEDRSRSEEHVVQRVDFSSFVLHSDKLAPDTQVASGPQISNVDLTRYVSAAYTRVVIVRKAKRVTRHAS